MSAGIDQPKPFQMKQTRANRLVTSRADLLESLRDRSSAVEIGLRVAVFRARNPISAISVI
jgi:hypothetical protein